LNIEDAREEKERHSWVLEHTSGQGADVVIQCVSGAVIPEGLGYLRPGGRYLSIGGGGGDITLPGLGQQVTIMSVRSGEGRHYHQALRFLETRRGEIPFERLLSGVYPIEKVTDALQAMAEFREVKAVVIPKEN
jgi:threonine dehydrogenase-like Zn-dependent dehydrogenase